MVHRALHNPPKGRYHGNPMTKAPGTAQWMAPMGYWGPLSMIAIPTMEYMQRYGATREDLAERRGRGARERCADPVVVLARQAAHDDDYLAARVLSDPICMYDCDIPVDGVAAFVFTTAERARDLPQRPGVRAGLRHGQPHAAPAPAALAARRHRRHRRARPRARLWESSGLSVRDVDVPQLYDGFSPLVWWWLEVARLLRARRGAPLRERRRDQRGADGGLPALSGGGAIGNGRMHGVPQMLEVYLQLAQRAGERQLASANVGLACHSSPHYGGAVLYSREPL